MQFLSEAQHAVFLLVNAGQISATLREHFQLFGTDLDIVKFTRFQQICQLLYRAAAIPSRFKPLWLLPMGLPEEQSVFERSSQTSKTVNKWKKAIKQNVLANATREFYSSSKCSYYRRWTFWTLSALNFNPFLIFFICLVYCWTCMDKLFDTGFGPLHVRINLYVWEIQHLEICTKNET